MEEEINMPEDSIVSHNTEKLNVTPSETHHDENGQYPQEGLTEPKVSDPDGELKTKQCDGCGQEVLAPGFENHRLKCTEKKDRMKQQTNIPTISSSLREIREFVALHNLDVNTHLSETNGKTTMIKNIQKYMPSPPENMKRTDPTTVHCKVCGWEVLKPGYSKHLWKCVARQEMLKKTTPIPQQGAPLREIKEFITLHGLTVDATLTTTRGKDDIIAEISLAMKPEGSSQGQPKEVDTVECELCGWQVLRPGYQQHLLKCREHQADLKKVTPLPHAESSLREIREFAQLHQMKQLDTKLSENHTKENILEEIKHTLLTPRPGQARVAWEDLPPGLHKDHEPETLHCEYCGWEVLKPGYHEHIKICKEKHESLKKTTPPPTEESSLRELRQFVQLHGWEIDTKLSAARSKKDIYEDILRHLGSSRKAADVETIHCSLCGWEVLKPGYNQHRWKCVAKYEKMKRTAEVPTEDSNLREIREFSEIYQLDLDTKLSPYNTKKDMIHQMNDKLQAIFTPILARSREVSSVGTPNTLRSRSRSRSKSRSRSRLLSTNSASGEPHSPAFLYARSRETSKSATDIQTVHCDLCGWEVLKPGFAGHRTKCVAKNENLKETTPMPSEDSNYREIKDFIFLHKLEVDTKLSHTRKKTDVYNDMKKAAQPILRAMRLKLSQQHSPRKSKSGARTPRAGTTPRSGGANGPVTVRCKLCGWEVLKPGYQKHLWKCTARQEMMRQQAKCPTEVSSLREIREYAMLHGVEDFDTKITSVRKKEDMIKELRLLLNLPSEEDETRERERSRTKSKDPETMHCEICGWEVLKPGYLLHLRKCREKQEDLKNVTELPTANSTVREIREFVALHALQIDTKLSNVRKKEDILADIMKHLPELKGEEMNRSRKNTRAAASGNDPETVHCKICGWEILKPGYNKHLFKCAAKQARLQQTTPLPGADADLREIREFVQLHLLDIETKMTTTRTKEDMVFEIQQAMSARGSSATTPRGSGHSSAASTPRALQTVHCSLCGWEVLKPGYQKHRWKCVARVAAQRQSVNIPTSDSSLRKLREFVTLNQMDIDTKLSNTRDKSVILKEIKKAMAGRRNSLSGQASPRSASPLRSPNRSSSLPSTTRQNSKKKNSPKGGGQANTPRNPVARRRISPGSTPKSAKHSRSASGSLSPRRSQSLGAGKNTTPKTSSSRNNKSTPLVRRALSSEDLGISQAEAASGDHNPDTTGVAESYPAKKGAPVVVPTVTGLSRGDSKVTSLNTVQCETCGQQVLQIGLKVHQKSCSEKKEGTSATANDNSSISSREPLPFPTQNSDMREIELFIVHHDLKVDTQLTEDRSKDDILRDIQVTLSQKSQTFIF